LILNNHNYESSNQHSPESAPGGAADQQLDVAAILNTFDARDQGGQARLEEILDVSKEISIDQRQAILGARSLQSSVHRWGVYIQMHVHMCINMYVCVYIDIHTCIYMYMCIYICVCIYTYIAVCMCVCCWCELVAVFVALVACIYMYVYIHVYLYI